MTASHPRRKLFDFPITTGGAPSNVLLWILGVLISFVVFICVTPVSGDVFLDPELYKEADLISHRVPRSLIQVDRESNMYDAHNNPSVLEAESGRSAGGGALETLRQLSLASTQPFIRRRLFNTSVALTVPLFSFTLPQRAAEGSTVDLANQAIFGLFALLTTLLVFAVPVVFTGIRPFNVYGRSMKDDSSTTQDILNGLMKGSEYTVNLMGKDLQNKIGLNPEECLKKTICDAHRHPKKYGFFALPFHIFYPPPPAGSEEYKSMNDYQMAASVGEVTKEECWDFYNCFFDVMDLALYFKDWFSPTHSEDQSSDSNNHHEL